MSDLDPRGLDAALREFGKCWNEPLPFDKAVAGAIRAYLDAIEPEGEPDRIAVVVNANGSGFGQILKSPEQDSAREIDGVLRVTERRAAEWFPGPFARAIVECRLPRPAEPAVVKGRVGDA